MENLTRKFALLTVMGQFSGKQEAAGCGLCNLTFSNGQIYFACKEQILGFALFRPRADDLDRFDRGRAPSIVPHPPRGLFLKAPVAVPRGNVNNSF